MQALWREYIIISQKDHISLMTMACAQISQINVTLKTDRDQPKNAHINDSSFTNLCLMLSNSHLVSYIPWKLEEAKKIEEKKDKMLLQ